MIDITGLQLKVYIIVDSAGRYGGKSAGAFTTDFSSARVFSKIGLARSWVTSYVNFETRFKARSAKPFTQDDVPRIIELTAHVTGVHNERKRIRKARLKTAKKQEKYAIQRMNYNVASGTADFTALQGLIAELEKDVADEPDFVAVTQGECGGR